MDIQSAKLTASQLWILYNQIRSSIYTAYKLYYFVYLNVLTDTCLHEVYTVCLFKGTI